MMQLLLSQALQGLLQNTIAPAETQERLTNRWFATVLTLTC